MTYIFAIYFTEILTVTRRDLQNDWSESSNLANLNRLYGTLPSTLLSFFQAMSGGIDWNDVVSPVLEFVGPSSALVLIFYIAFAILAMMNVVTGLFVQNVMERAEEVQRTIQVSNVRRLFEELDVDTSGSITYQELEQCLHLKSGRDFFRSINICIDDAKALFDVLDCDGSGNVDFSEFMNACLKLQGPASSADLFLSMRETQQSFEEQKECLRHIADVFDLGDGADQAWEDKQNTRGCSSMTL
eukprot:TRINITY_DN9448_c0_g1_i6.p1 TRINITY_DN9448_c0_g1~~TRINITY_DN9448_c0_g1_i6.p1  ORF type:complete len:284 (-),score=41.06 TRINITY_DN9448_c0_g1_i6:218-949(-)